MTSLDHPSRAQRIQRLRSLLQERVLVLDGPMGTAIQERNLTAYDFGGEASEGCCENLNVLRPDIIFEIIESYLKAGADIVKTNSFSGSRLVLGEFGLQDQAYAINLAAAQVARRAADGMSSPEKPRFVAGSIGPSTKSLSVTGGIDFDDLVEEFVPQIEGLYDGGIDYFLIETCQDTRNIKAILEAIDRVQEKRPLKLPIAVSGTIEPMGTMLAGQGVDALYASLMHRDLLYLGLNCATGPEFMTDHIRTLAQLSSFPVACAPNAGLPDEDGRYLETPEMMSRVLNQFGERGWLNVIGGCCGTTAAHIQAFVALAKQLKPHQPLRRDSSILSGIELLEVNDDVRPVLVGERTNVIGSRKFKRLISEEKWDEASEIARAQIRNQAQIIDICLANPDRDELADMKKFLDVVMKKISTPIMIDSTDSEVIETALKYSQGKAIINSINLEDGEERFESVCPLAKRFGAALIVGTIDDDPQQGMGVSLERKLAIAERSFDLLTKKYGVLPEDIVWDPLVFPCGTGDPQYVGSAVHTMDAVRELKRLYPKSKTILGVSNVSFGLPEAGREVLNSVFLYHCTQAGLDMAIVNTEKLERFAEISEEEKALCENLLWNRGENPLNEFNFYFGKKERKTREPRESLPLEERLARAVVEGSKDGLLDDLAEAMQGKLPLEIINGPLMKGMDEVGRLFNENKLIVAEVLQSAEVMKAAVNFLKPHMEKSDSALRGRVVLATVKGDVHDIGKNLVDIILSNNGFEVINLGIKIPSQELIAAAKRYNPHVIGLSGLLVKSAQQMVETASDLAAVGIHTPLLVGGAALTRQFTDRKIAPAYGEGFVEYAKDAMDGLELSKKIVDLDSFKTLRSVVEERRRQMPQKSISSTASAQQVQIRSDSVPPQASPASPPDLKRHVLQIPLERVWPFINPLMLLGRHLGVKGSHIRAFEDPKKRREFLVDPDFQKSLEIAEALERVKVEAKSWMQVKSVYQFFKAESEGNTLHLLDSESKRRLISWSFKRQVAPQGLCLADYVNPTDYRTQDYVCLFVTTAQGPTRKMSELAKERGEFLNSHIIQSLALETAEAAAEYLHSFLRSQWGFPDHPDMSMMDRFQAKYRGKRYSFGYPACPELEFQRELFEVLKPEDVGVELTEGFMMSPESSVSALVFSHPSASYFGVKGE
jgi:5-methyltetrahydrofolate--homocysteine methyltransferase